MSETKLSRAVKLSEKIGHAMLDAGTVLSVLGLAALVGAALVDWALSYRERQDYADEDGDDDSAYA